MFKSRSVRQLVRGALIAALYATLTLIALATPFGSLYFSNIQVRLPEMLTVLPAFTTAAIPGLFVGCLVTNILGLAFNLGCGIYDVIFGSLATLIAAWMSYKLRRHPWLVPLPPVLVNALVVGTMLHFVLQMPWIFSMISVGIGQAVACYCLGIPLQMALKKYAPNLFSDPS